MRIYPVNSVFGRGISNRPIEMNWNETRVSDSCACLLIVCHTITFSLYWMRHFVLLKLVLNWFMAQYVNAKAPQTTTAQTRTHIHIHSNTHILGYAQAALCFVLCLFARWLLIRRVVQFNENWFYSVTQSAHTPTHSDTHKQTDTHTQIHIHTHINYACVLIPCCFCRFSIHIADLHPAFFSWAFAILFQFLFFQLSLRPNRDIYDTWP